jgi:hypothetical protein
LTQIQQVTNSALTSDGFAKNRTLILERTINVDLQNPEPDLNRFEKGSCLRVGVLTNPRSGGNKKGLSKIRSLLANHPEALHREEFTPKGMSDALSDFSKDGVEMVVINGGDGTVHAALTTIGRGDAFSKPPLLALLCAGTTSMLPRDVGIKGSPVEALSQALQWARSTDEKLNLLSRHVLEVKRGTGQPPLFGMFFGAGAITQGIKLFHKGVNPMGWRGEIMPGLTLLRMLVAILRKDHSKVPPLLVRARLDKQSSQDSETLLVLISTLERLFLGMRPYWGEEGGHMHYTSISSHSKKLFRVLPSLFSRQKNRYATPENGYISHKLNDVELEMDRDFTLDGELYESGQEPVIIRPAGPFTFLSSYR